jgi:hypothetical protein
MTTYSFSIVAAGPSGMEPEEFADRLAGQGCDDATVSLQKGAFILDFDREERSFVRAVLSAIRDVVRAGGRVTHVEPDHLVSLSDIAVRAGVTRAAASLYAKGERGERFPAPVARVTTDSPLWDWVEVSRWLWRRKRISLDEVLHARVVRLANVRISAQAMEHPAAVERAASRIGREEAA